MNANGAADANAMKASILSQMPTAAAAASQLNRATIDTAPVVEIVGANPNTFDLGKYEDWKRANPINNSRCSATPGWIETTTSYEAAQKCEASEGCLGVMFKYDDDRSKWDFVIGSPFLAFLKAEFHECRGSLPSSGSGQGWLTVAKPPHDSASRR